MSVWGLWRSLLRRVVSVTLPTPSVLSMTTPGSNKGLVAPLVSVAYDRGSLRYLWGQYEACTVPWYQPWAGLVPSPDHPRQPVAPPDVSLQSVSLPASGDGSRCCRLVSVFGQHPLVSLVSRPRPGAAVPSNRLATRRTSGRPGAVVRRRSASRRHRRHTSRDWPACSAS